MAKIVDFGNTYGEFLKKYFWRPETNNSQAGHAGTVKYYAQIHLQVWQNSVCTGQGNLPLIT